MNLTMTLSTSSINEVKRQLRNYRNSINVKLQRVEERLIDYGITTAYQNMGYIDGDDASGLVAFTREYQNGRNGVKALMIAYDKAPLVKYWMSKDESGQLFIKSANVSPILMYEFGSGIYAEAGHAGTFPSDTAKQNVANGYWRWQDLSGNWHTSSGIAPKYPLQYAFIDMESRVNQVAREVFKYGI